MRILCITGVHGRISETFIRDLQSGLVERGNAVEVICSHKDPSFKGEKIPILCSYYQKIGRLGALALALVPMIPLRARVRLCSHAYAALAGKALSLFAARRLKCVDVVYVDFGANGALLSALMRRYPSRRFVVHFHGCDVSRDLNDSWYSRELRGLLSRADVLIAPSAYLARKLQLLGAEPRKIHTINYDVPLQLVAPASWAARQAAGPSAVFFGRLTAKKNPVALIEAFRLVLQVLPAARLTIIGGGELRGEVEERIRTHGMGMNVSLLPAMPREKAFAILRMHWIYVQLSVTPPSGDQEGYPVSPLEAAAHGLPLVLTAHSGMSEQVKDGENGFLVAEHDFPAAAKRIEELLSSPALTERMGTAARNRILVQCSQVSRVAKIEAVMK